MLDELTVKADIAKVILHPEWNANENKYRNDIALVFLAEKVQFSEKISPACLPEHSEDFFKNSGYIVGWGKTHRDPFEGSIYSNTLNELFVKSYSGSYCYSQYPDLGRMASEKMFCAGYEQKNKSACLGDSGGGFYSVNSETSEHVVDGIVSSTLADDNNQCDADIPSLYTNVRWFVNWIKSELKKSEEPTEVEFNCVNDYGYIRCMNSYNGSYNTDLRIKVQQNLETSTLPLQIDLGSLPNIIPGIEQAFPRVQDVLIFGESLRLLKRRDFKKLTNLRKLGFSNTGIRRIAVDAFADLNELEEVRMPFVEDLKLHELLSSTPKLNILKIENIKGSTLPNNFFDKLPQLKEIDLSENNNDLTLEGFAFRLPNIQKLNIRMTSINHPTKSLFSWLPKLKVLDMGNMADRTVLPRDVFDNLENLEELYLDWNMGIVNGFVFNLPKLEKLILYGSGVKPTKEMFAGVPKLKYLDLSQNYMGFLPSDVFDHVSNLVELYIPRNHLDLKGFVFKLPKLQILDLSMNEVEATEEMFSGLTSLKEVLSYKCDQLQSFLDILKSESRTEVECKTDMVFFNVNH